MFKDNQTNSDYTDRSIVYDIDFARNPLTEYGFNIIDALVPQCDFTPSDIEDEWANECEL